jgi:hypothetical protein
MARIYWDRMLFIYLFQNDPVYGERGAAIRESLVRRGDELCTSHLGLGEVLAGAYRDRSEAEAKAIKQGFADAAVRLLRSIWRLPMRLVESGRVMAPRRPIRFIWHVRRWRPSICSSPGTGN